MKPSYPTPDGKADDLVWNALGQLRDSPPVDEAYAFVRDRAARREPLRRLRETLAMLLSPRAMVAMGSVAAMALIFITFFLPTSPQTVATAIGQRKTVVLVDGSKLILDSDTRLAVTIDRAERRLVLLKGQANFEVAHDSSRPFRVTAGGMTVTAIGTNFDVAALPDRRAVTLIDGKVAVELAGQAGPAGQRVVLLPGQRLAVGPDGQLGEPQAVDMEGVLAWHQGRIEFENVTVAEALAEANRYSKARIRLLDETSAGKRIDGVFRTDQIDGMVAALCAYLNLEVVFRSEEEVVLDRAAR